MDTPPKVRCLVLEDEQLGLIILKDYISRLPFLELTAVATNGAEALKLIQTQPFDLLFLDIQVPLLSGIELLKQLSHPPKVIFTTAFPNFAAQAYELDAIDYLVKPYSFERFHKAVYKVLQLTTQQTIQPSATAHTNAFIYLKSGGAQVKILLHQIVYIESQRNILLVHLAGKEHYNRPITTYLTINELEDRLPKALFVRIHKSFIVAHHFIEAYSAATVTIAGQPFAIGRSYKEEALRVIANYFGR